MSKNKSKPIFVGTLGSVEDFVQYLLCATLKLPNKLESKVLDHSLITIQDFTLGSRCPSFKLATYLTTEGVVILLLRLNRAQYTYEPTISLTATHKFEKDAGLDRFHEIKHLVDKLSLTGIPTEDTVWFRLQNVI